MAKYSEKAQSKIGLETHKFAQGKPHSGSKKGPKVKSRKQALAIGLSAARKKGLKVPKRKTK